MKNLQVVYKELESARWSVFFLPLLVKNDILNRLKMHEAGRFRNTTDRRCLLK